MLIIVTGQPRCGTSMISHGLHLAGVPKAFKDNENKSGQKMLRNPNGLYEGPYQGGDGFVKLFGVRQFPKRDDIKVILMTRKAEKITKSWDEIRERMKKEHPERKRLDTLPPLQARINGINDRFTRLREELNEYPVIEIDYDTFVKTPETYRERFTTLFPDINFDTLISTIDKDIYRDR